MSGKCTKTSRKVNIILAMKYNNNSNIKGDQYNLWNKRGGIYYGYQHWVHNKCIKYFMDVIGNMPKFMWKVTYK